MPTYFNLQLFAEEMAVDTGVSADSTSENPAGEGVATEDLTGEQIAAAQEQESWDSLIKGKYKKEYGEAVQNAIKKRFKNQRDLQGQIDMLDPMIKALAQRYDIQADAQGRIPIEALSSKIMDDNSMYEDEAFQRGIPVEDLKQMKALERENQMLKAQQTRNAEQEEWDGIIRQSEMVKEMYPDFDIEVEMQNPDFGRLLSTMQRSGFPNAVQTAYEAVHREEIMGGAMRYAVQQTKQKISNSIQSGMSRPQENGTVQSAPGTATGLDPSKLSKAQIEDIKSRAARGERITF